MFKDQEGVEVHNYAKNEWRQYPGIFTEQAWPINNLLLMDFDKPGIASGKTFYIGQDIMHLSLQTPTPHTPGRRGVLDSWSKKRKKKPHPKGRIFYFKPQLKGWIFKKIG